MTGLSDYDVSYRRSDGTLGNALFCARSWEALVALLDGAPTTGNSEILSITKIPKKPVDEPTEEVLLDCPFRASDCEIVSDYGGIRVTLTGWTHENVVCNVLKARGRWRLKMYREIDHDDAL